MKKKLLAIIAVIVGIFFAKKKISDRQAEEDLWNTAAEE
ncbi:unannotated protein [freshwater metagenome]|uniref:Unannotated protein n=1 Tax=freshwater metagenome TaxID=449393 RepID=A0A6J6W9Z1_9ZZZZ